MTKYNKNQIIDHISLMQKDNQENRTITRHFRVTPSEDEEIRRKVLLSGKTFSRFVRDKLLNNNKKKHRQ